MTKNFEVDGCHSNLHVILKHLLFFIPFRTFFVSGFLWWTDRIVIQSKLSIADMLHNRHLVIVDISLRNRPNHGQTLIEIPLYSGHFYSGHFVIAGTFFKHRVYILGKIYLLIADTLWLVGKIENTWKVLFDTFLYFNMKLII